MKLSQSLLLLAGVQAAAVEKCPAIEIAQEETQSANTIVIKTKTDSSSNDDSFWFYIFLFLSIIAIFGIFYTFWKLCTQPKIRYNFMTNSSSIDDDKIAHQDQEVEIQT